jgi:regulation of enolase protein 1 (concanavalin A-like superfamily)
LSRRKLRISRRQVRFGRRAALESLEPRLNMSHDGTEAVVYEMPAALQALAEADAAAVEGQSSPNPFAGAFTYETLANGMPILNSYPAAPASIFIDFDGGVYHGSFTAEPYDVDGAPTTFNLEEQGTIVEAWRQMSMYYGMFNVNVTTIQPASSHPKAWLVVGNNVSGGSSYINVFPNSRAESRNQSSDARGRVSGLAHEIGHNFGNQHTSNYDNLGNKTSEYHGAFDALHGPIMGIDYSGTIHKFTMWHNATRANALQDDMARIAQDLDNYGGDGYKADDYAGMIATATALTPTGVTQARVGIIERLTDADAFSFASTGGRYAISVGRDAPSGVDVKVSVYNAAGALLASKDGDPRALPIAMVNDVHLTLDLPAGTFYVIVESHGNYGDQGQYIVRVDPVPAGWSSEAIGVVGLPGASSYNSSTSTFTVAGSGAIDGSSDEFHSLFQKLTGDGSITVRVTGVENTNSAARAGIMIREDLSEGSRYAAVLATPSSGTQWQTRFSAGTNPTNSSSGGSFSAIWLRLTRVGNNFTAYTSPNGTTWTQLGSPRPVAMAATVYIGLAASANNNLRLSAATFTNVSLTGSLNVQPPATNLPTPPAPTVMSSTSSSVTFQWGGVVLTGDTNFDRVVDNVDLTAVRQQFGSNGTADVNGDGVVDIIDYNTVKANIGTSLAGYAVERSADGINFTQVGTTDNTVRSFTDSGLADALRYFYRVRARANSGVSAPSSAVNTVTKAGAISNFNIISYATDELILDWSDASGESNYRIQRSSDGVSGWINRGTVDKNVPSFNDTGLAAGTVYYYKVETLVGGVVTATSIALSASTRLPDVTGLAFTNKASNQMAIAWNAVAGATGYRLERWTLANGWQTVSSSWNGTTYTDNSVSPLGQYFYAVTARNALSESESGVTVFAASPATTSLPAGWSSQDIGSVGGSGAAGFSGSTYTLIASGTDIWSTADEFRYVYTSLNGNGSITARVASIEPDDDWTFGGVMIRESTAAGAKNANVVISPNHESYIQWRSSTNGASSHTAGAAVEAPYWVRLTRNGSTFTGEISANGTNWTSIGTATVSMANSVLVGLVVSSIDNADLDTVTFDNVTMGAAAGAFAGAVSPERSSSIAGATSASRRPSVSGMALRFVAGTGIAMTERASINIPGHTTSNPTKNVVQPDRQRVVLSAIENYFEDFAPDFRRERVNSQTVKRLRHHDFFSGHGPISLASLTEYQWFS